MERVDIINLLISEIEQVFFDEDLASMTPFARKVNIFRRVSDPVNLDDDMNLPAMFFGYGDTTLNDENVGTNYQGEFLNIVVTVAIDEVHEDGLIIDVANMHKTLENIVRSLSGEANIRSAKVASAVPFTEGLSDIEMMRFVVEIDWFFLDD